MLRTVGARRPHHRPRRRGHIRLRRTAAERQGAHRPASTQRQEALAWWSFRLVGSRYRLLREACDRGTLLCGISAGANCWLEGSHTDSFGPLTFLRDGLGILPGSVCPHYDSEPGRRDSYREAVATGRLSAGWAVEDGVGALFADGRLEEAVSRTPKARLRRVWAEAGRGVRERALPCRLLGGGEAGAAATGR
ncbi:type 1 glutamine amidotransferase-like domain-containing protein [Streptomyces sp. SID9944]|nr:type 1 glutamine amidotransferase-like domain-containing protein [Streptomyces sp. SID9944]